MVQCITPHQVTEAFIANIPLMQSTIRDMTLAAPNWFRDIYKPMPWPEGEGTSMQQISFAGELPAVEEGFDSWALIDDPSGCGDVCAPNCSYNMHMLGGHAMNTKVTRLMSKDLRSPDYCVAAIQNTRQYKEVFSQIVSNMYNQINFQKEVNIGQNFLTGIAKKAVIDSAGFKFNPQDPYAYRPIGSTILSAPSIGILEFLYEMIRRSPRVTPFGYQNNMPLYALVASPQFFSQLYRADPSLRADYRAAAAGSSEYADQLINRYNFTNTIRDMFLPVGYFWPRRYRYDSDDDVWIRVLPWVKGVPGTVGTFTDINPLYEDPSYATHEEVLIHGKDPFSLFYQPMVQTIGEGTDFGPEPQGFWDVLQWVNPQTRQDPGRREGFFFTTAKIALSADNSEGVYGIMFPRATVAQAVSFYQNPVDPPATPAAPTNVVDDVGCPVPMIVSLEAHPLTAGDYFVVFAAPVDAEAEDVIQLGHSNGGYVNATVVEVDSTGKIFQVTISGTLPTCDRWVSVYTGDTLGCSANVVAYSVDPADGTRLYLTLDRPIKADTAADVVTLNYGNGAQVSATVVAAVMTTNRWHVDIGSSAFADTVNGIASICVPTATDDTCPGCSTALATVTQCEEA